MSQLIDEAVSAARAQDSIAFKRAIASLGDAGWALSGDEISDRFVAEARQVVPDGCSLDHIVDVAWSSYAHTSKFLNITAYDIEFIIRGYRGASPLMRAYSQDVILTIAIALTGIWQRPDWAVEPAAAASTG